MPQFTSIWRACMLSWHAKTPSWMWGRRKKPCAIFSVALGRLNPARDLNTVRIFSNIWHWRRCSQIGAVILHPPLVVISLNLILLNLAGFVASLEWHYLEGWINNSQLARCLWPTCTYLPATVLNACSFPKNVLLRMPVLYTSRCCRVLVYFKLNVFPNGSMIDNFMKAGSSQTHHWYNFKTNMFSKATKFSRHKINYQHNKTVALLKNKWNYTRKYT